MRAAGGGELYRLLIVAVHGVVDSVIFDGIRFLA